MLADAGADVLALDVHRPFLDRLAEAAAARGLPVRTTCRSMADLPHPDASFDLLWAEGSAYLIGFAEALRQWRRLLAPGGALVVTEAEWAVAEPSAAAREFWAQHGGLRTAAGTVAAARTAGYDVEAVLPLPDRDWFDEYYGPLAERVGSADLDRPGMPEAVARTSAEIRLRREHPEDYRYTGYVLRPTSPRPGPPWTARAEVDADRPRVRAVNLTAFPGAAEADLVDALRADPDAWIPGLSWVATSADGRIAGHALLTRCQVGGAPALALAPCAVRPEDQRRGAGSAAIRGALDAARQLGENLVVVLGHADYYPRFGFTPAAGFGIRAGFEVPAENLMALALDPSRPVPTGTIRYPAAFGV
ncbi:GNAT family N-acetyltransferase [Saccharopolyspora sp. CA-218241]|uniref:GNAT family N-acetyltransferase n=1 Tax=Saccharopolyspora sp. CA-218241 TaxID=3240027 RepID=UPI003D96CB07